jgi:hypothetical protein
MLRCYNARNESLEQSDKGMRMDCKILILILYPVVEQRKQLHSEYKFINNMT